MREPGETTIHLWLTDCRAVDAARQSAFARYLGGPETERLNRIRSPARRSQFLLGRLLLRHMLVQYRGGSLGAWRLDERPGLPPLLHGADDAHFSISHSGAWAACALTCTGPVGLDIEDRLRERDALALAEFAFSAEEAAWLRSQPTSARLTAFYHLWTAKEAWIKCEVQSATPEALRRRRICDAAGRLVAVVPLWLAVTEDLALAIAGASDARAVKVSFASFADDGEVRVKHYGEISRARDWPAAHGGDWPSGEQRMNRKHRCTLIAAALLAAGTASAQEASWDIGLGFSVLDFPHYVGASERTTLVVPFPYVYYRSERFEVDRNAAHGRLFERGRVKVELSLGGTLPVDSDNDDARAGMPDLDVIGEIGPSLIVSLWNGADGERSVKFELPYRRAYSTDLTRVDERGWFSDPRLRYTWERATPTGSAQLESTLAAVYASEDYHSYFYEVTPQLVTAQRPVFDASGGYGGWRFSVGFSRRHNNFWYGAFARYFNIRGADFEASPLVREHESLYAGLAMAWIIHTSRKKDAP